MSHLVIVGGSTGIGRDIQPLLRMVGYKTTTLPRDGGFNALDALSPSALLLCQRYRGDAVAHEAWQKEFDVSMTRTKLVCEWARWNAKPLSIVVMASVASEYVEEEQPVGYHACKAALREMVKWYAVGLGPKQIRVNAIIPGITIKPEARAFYDAHPKLEATYRRITPLGRVGTVGDLAHLVDFLIGDRSSYMTGQTLTLDGGIGLRSQWSVARMVDPELSDLQVTQRKAV